MWWEKKYEDFRAEIREFAETVIAPIADRMEKNSSFDQSMIPLLHRRGLLSMILPKQYAGAGFDTLEYTIAVEEVSRVCGSTGTRCTARAAFGRISNQRQAVDRRFHDGFASLGCLTYSLRSTAHSPAKSCRCANLGQNPAQLYPPAVSSSASPRLINERSRPGSSQVPAIG